LSLVVEVVEQMAVEVVELEDIELLVMVQVRYKQVIYLYLQEITQLL
jgi:hypothetical protein